MASSFPGKMIETSSKEWSRTLSVTEGTKNYRRSGGNKAVVGLDSADPFIPKALPRTIETVCLLSRAIAERGCSCLACRRHCPRITTSNVGIIRNRCEFSSSEELMATVVVVGTVIPEDKEKKYCCEICDRKFYQSSNLATHMRTHTGEKPFQCIVCCSSFSQSSNLRRHMQVHSGDKPYECNLCGKKSSRKGSIIMHMRTHTGEKPFQCNICQKRFSIKSSLTVHRRIHSGERPFECLVCKKRFPRKSEVKRHMKHHSNCKK